jgi:putative hydrolase of the HAD superfamily
VQLLERVQETVTTLAQQYQLMLITKGDLLDQESKIAQSGLADYFRHIEIISEKTEATYAAILAKYGIPPERFLMVGNSLKSDILPVVAIGGQAVHIPYHITWSHEVIADADSRQQGYVTLEHIGLLPDLVEQMQHR